MENLLKSAEIFNILLKPFQTGKYVYTRCLLQELTLDKSAIKIVNFLPMKYLVTGATGFIGSSIVDRLVKDGKNVVCLIRKEADLRWLREYSDRVSIRYGDFLFPQTLKDTFEDIDTVIHTAGVLNTYDWHNYYLINFLGTKNIIRACSESGRVRKFIYLSNLNAAGPSLSKDFKTENDLSKPVSHFGRSKLLGEEELLKFKDQMNVIILRPTLVYGPRDLNLLALFKMASYGFFVVFGDDEKIINLCYIADMVDGVSAVLEREIPSGEIINIGGENYPLYEIKDGLSKVIQKKLRTVRLGKWILLPISYTAEITGRVMKKPLVLSLDKVIDLSQNNWGVRIDKAKQMLSYSPKVPLLEGLEKTYDWYKKNGYL